MPRRYWGSARSLRVAGFVLGVCVVMAAPGVRSQSAPSPANSTLEVPSQYGSIQAALNAANSGDVILVAPGTYTGSLTLAKAVTLASWFLTTGDESYIETTILDGGGGSEVIEIPETAEDRPTITGFTIQNADDGIFPSAKFDLLHNRIRWTNDGVDYEDGSGGLCLFNVFELNDDDGIDLDDAVDIVIEHNTIRNNGDDGIEVRLQDYTGPTLDILIHHNAIFGNGEDGIQLIDYGGLTDRYFQISYNAIYDNVQAGLGLMGGSRTEENYEAWSIPEPIDVIGNTFVNNNHGMTGGDNAVLLNNIFVGHPVLALKNVDGSSVAAFNLFHANGTDHVGSNVDAATAITADPLLDSGLRLLDGSPAIDAGTDFYTSRGATVLDLDPSEYQGAAPDLGAFEFENDCQGADADGDGFLCEVDCDDGDDQVNPGASEVCDAVDNDCDGDVDEADAIDAATWFLDGDGDGFGDGADAIQACVQPAGRVADASDCDDGDGSVYPGAVDVCDGVDNDCDGLLDEDFAPQATTCGLGACAGNVGATTCVGGVLSDSCDPLAGAAASDAVCDGVDDDCDGSLDEDFGGQSCATGLPGVCSAGATACVEGIESCAPLVPPADDDAVCNGVDDDCDGSLDEDFPAQPTTCGVGVCADAGVTTCTAGVVGDSCTPGAPEVETCGDGLDNDCDGTVDCGDGDCQAAPACSAPTVLEIGITSDANDVEERESGEIYPDSSDLELVADRGNQTVGLRFGPLDVPQGARIQHAHVQFQVDEATSVATSLLIEGEAVGNASPFTRSSENVSSRARTAAAVSWNPPAWNEKHVAGPDQQTPDLSRVIEEIVGRDDWSSNQWLVLIITGTGERVAESYKGTATGAPRLVVEYND